MKPAVPPGRTTASRAVRGAARERRRRLVALAVAVAVAAAAAAWLWGRGGSAAPGPVAGSGNGGASPAEGILAISLRDAAVPLMAVVGTAGTTAPPILTIPYRLSLEVPGLGDGTSAEISRQDAEEMRTSLSNTVGTWIDHVAVFDRAGLAAAVDRAGGIEVTLPSPATIDGVRLEAGPRRMSGDGLAAYLSIDGPNAFTRWEVVLVALAADPPSFSRADVIRSDDIAGVNGVFAAARGAHIVTFPSKLVTGRTRVPDYAALDSMMATEFGVPAPPIPVLMQNGVGDPGLGAGVASLIVPKGFRVVLSQNAAEFGHEQTQVVATGEDHIADARTIRRALGVGVVAVSRVPSGLADVTIVVGKDFTA